ncbi:MAG: hypothetical protein JSU70_11140 [Phycisphaerales bacterium]|nr:MAG: hypothetical protein JSU70_11140 [Phycisphaerales bacterium]
MAIVVTILQIIGIIVCMLVSYLMLNLQLWPLSQASALLLHGAGNVGTLE